jgi:hypothetical protein
LLLIMLVVRIRAYLSFRRWMSGQDFSSSNTPIYTTYIFNQSSQLIFTLQQFRCWSPPLCQLQSPCHFPYPNLHQFWCRSPSQCQLQSPHCFPYQNMRWRSPPQCQLQSPHHLRKCKPSSIVLYPKRSIIFSRQVTPCTYNTMHLYNDMQPTMLMYALQAIPLPN